MSMKVGRKEVKVGKSVKHHPSQEHEVNTVGGRHRDRVAHRHLLFVLSS